MKVRLKKILLLLCFSLCFNAAMPQQLELEGGKDDTSVSTKINSEGAVSSRVIFYTNIKVRYGTNMGDIPAENIKSGVVNEMMVDTIYFFLDVTDSFRRINISADGFATSTISVNLTPKATYKYTVIDPASGGSEYSQLLDSGNKASAEHKYDIAAGFYRQAMSAEGAPADLSAVRGYIEVMETCDEHLKYAKRCLIAAKKMKDEGGEKVDLKKIREYYEDALKSYNGIKEYMNDEKHDTIIGKIKSAISSLPAMIVEGVVEDASDTSLKLSGVNIYAMRSQDDKNPSLLATTDEKGTFRIEILPRDKSIYKLLLFDPGEIKGYKKGKQIELSTIHDYSKLRIKLFK